MQYYCQVRPGQLHWAHVHRGKVSVRRARTNADLQREETGVHGDLQGQPNFLSWVLPLLENTSDSAASNNGLTMLTGSEGQGLGGA